ncbi:hypothetical protein SUDANB96_04633 [Streptomyces sp. enrichment culture]
MSTRAPRDAVRTRPPGGAVRTHQTSAQSYVPEEDR